LSPYASGPRSWCRLIYHERGRDPYHRRTPRSDHLSRATRFARSTGGLGSVRRPAGRLGRPGGHPRRLRAAVRPRPCSLRTSPQRVESSHQVQVRRGDCRIRFGRSVVSIRIRAIRRWLGRCSCSCCCRGGHRVRQEARCVADRVARRARFDHGPVRKRCSRAGLSREEGPSGGAAGDQSQGGVGALWRRRCLLWQHPRRQSPVPLSGASPRLAPGSHPRRGPRT
jgi:hypothetical protein